MQVLQTLLVITLAVIPCTYTLSIKQFQECYNKIDFSSICPSSSNCYKELQQKCPNNSNKSCKIVNDYLSQFSEDLFKKKMGQKDVLVSPEEFKNIVENKYPLNTNEVKKEFQTWFEKYKTSYESWNKDQSNQQKEQELLKQFKEFDDKISVIIVLRGNLTRELIQAKSECEKNCGTLVTDKNAKEIQDKKVQCHANNSNTINFTSFILILGSLALL